MRRTARHTFATVTIAALLFACSGDPEPEPLDLTADDDGAEESDDSNADGAEGVDGEVAAELPEPAYPELPPFEPDPDSDVPEDEQREVYDFYVEAYAAIQSSLATATTDESLTTFLSDTVHDDLIAVITDLEEQGAVLRAPDTEITSVQIDGAGPDEYVLYECRRLGERTGTYERSSGEAVNVGPAAITASASRIHSDGDQLLIVGTAGSSDAQRCEGDQ
ncbi:hypothetical protein FTX61_21160 [Nitriliruptoraceae bacterium ZYF776]|nr:hypothetical protein [Profundirhabdus halotolerans]